MKNDMIVPFGFVRCFQAHCPLKEKCLRYYVAQNEETDAPSLSIVNPRLIPEDASKCPHFYPIQIRRVAWGVKHLFDEVPAKQLYSLKKQVISHIGRTRYYRCYRMEQGLLPDDQQFIAAAFKKYGLEATPCYERFTEEFDWP
ncbi:MAG: hypothetical protein E7099_02810 [Mediterranea massiliensis]|nr:hypothetical protein [Mediterranea massiliensis]